MGTPHKHAEILKAIADGKDVQFQLLGKWFDYTALENLSPLDEVGENRAWRIKPEHKEAVTRDGRKVTQLTEFSFDDNESCLVGVLDNMITQWGLAGNYHLDSTPSNRDIFVQTEEVKE